MRSHPGSKFWTHQQAGVVKIEKKSTGELVIKAQLPGVARDDIRLELKEDDQELSVLTLTANKKEEHHHTDKHGGTFYRTSDFQIVRTIPLNAKVSSDDIKADLADELLVIEVNLPPQKDKPSSRIDIHSATAQQQQQQQQVQGQRKQPGKLQQQRAGKGEAMDTDISGQHTHAQ
jgi:HSP20 family protein